MIADDDAKSERAALVCLIEAVGKLEAEQPIAHRGSDQHPTLVLPKYEHVDFSSHASVSPPAAKGKE